MTDYEELERQAKASTVRINDEPFVVQIAKATNCLPSVFVGNNGHIVKAAEDMKQRIATLQRELTAFGKDQIFHACGDTVRPYPAALCSVCQPKGQDFNAFQRILELEKELAAAREEIGGWRSDYDLLSIREQEKHAQLIIANVKSARLQAALPALSDIQLAINRIQSSIDSHVLWRDYRAEQGKEHPEYGDIEHHKQCLIEYAEVMKVLQLVKTVLSDEKLNISNGNPERNVLHLENEIRKLKEEKRTDYNNLKTKYEAAERNLENNPEKCGGVDMIKGYMSGLIEGMTLLNEHTSVCVSLSDKTSEILSDDVKCEVPHPEDEIRRLRSVLEIVVFHCHHNTGCVACQNAYKAATSGFFGKEVVVSVPLPKTLVKPTYDDTTNTISSPEQPQYLCQKYKWYRPCVEMSGEKYCPLFGKPECLNVVVDEKQFKKTIIGPCDLNAQERQKEQNA